MIQSNHRFGLILRRISASAGLMAELSKVLFLVLMLPLRSHFYVTGSILAPV